MDCSGQEIAHRSKTRKFFPAFVAFAALLLAGCNPAAGPAAETKTAATGAAGDGPTNPPGGHPLSATPEEDEFGEFLAKPAELLPVPVNEIVKSIRLNAIAIATGPAVYEKHCASCHGPELKGDPAQHTPDLTDTEWRFSGDELASGGETKLPSDVEWTIRYGIRSGHPYARGIEADMLAFDPQYRNEHDIGDFGKVKTVNDTEIADIAEYVLKLSGQQADEARVANGEKLFLDNSKGNCADCHDDEGTGNPALGSTNLTRKELYIYGSDRASIIESITKGRRGVMPAFDGILKPEELKAVSVFVFWQARIAPPPTLPAK